MASWLYPLAVNKNVGQTVYLTATGSGSAAPSPVYTALFRVTASIGTPGASIVSTGALTATYAIPAVDSGKTLTFYAKVTDNCSTPMTSPEVSDTAVIAVQCVSPTCGFSLS